MAWRARACRRDGVVWSSTRHGSAAADWPVSRRYFNARHEPAASCGRASREARSLALCEGASKLSRGGGRGRRRGRASRQTNTADSSERQAGRQAVSSEGGEYKRAERQLESAWINGSSRRSGSHEVGKRGREGEGGGVGAGFFLKAGGAAFLTAARVVTLFTFLPCPPRAALPPLSATRRRASEGPGRPRTLAAARAAQAQSERPGAPWRASVLLPSSAAADDAHPACEPSLRVRACVGGACVCVPTTASCRAPAVARTARWLLATGPLLASVSGIQRLLRVSESAAVRWCESAGQPGAVLISLRDRKLGIWY